MAQKFKRHHRKRERNEDHDHPARHVHRAHIDVAAHVIGPGHIEAVPGQHRAHGDAEHADHDAHPMAVGSREMHQHDLDVDVAALAHQPRRAQAGNDQQGVFGEGEQVRRALMPEIAQHHIDANADHHRPHQKAGAPGHAVHQAVVGAREQGHGGGGRGNSKI